VRLVRKLVVVGAPSVPNGDVDNCAFNQNEYHRRDPEDELE
jgi:hypothetical protein